MDPVLLANLLAQLLPLGVQVYREIQQANADQLKPIEDILTAADTNWDAVTATAQAELKPAAPDPVSPEPAAQAEQPKTGLHALYSE